MRNFTSIRNTFLTWTRDGMPDDSIPPGIHPDDPRLPELERIASLRPTAQFMEGLREIICVAATGRRYADLENEARGILRSTKKHSASFRRQFKAFLKLISVHTYATPRGSEDCPALRLTEEFWSKEWVRPAFEKAKEIDSAAVYKAMADGASGKFISGKTRGKDLIVYIASSSLRWDAQQNTLDEIATELREAGFGEWLDKHQVDGVDLENIRKALASCKQDKIFFHPVQIGELVTSKTRS